MTKHRGSDAGFTLIELSIVLVLIGLIIGGVLKGQELVASTRLKMTVSQWDAVKAAINTFQDKYVALPGDYSEATTYIKQVADGGAPDGNGDGLIAGASGPVTSFGDALTANDTGVNEHKNAWRHLSDAGLMGSVDLTDGRESLPGKVAGSYFHIYYGTHHGRTAHWMRLQAESDAASAPKTDILSPKEAAELDRKFDDGRFSSGAIQAGKVGDGAAPCKEDSLSDEDVCTVVFEIF